MLRSVITKVSFHRFKQFRDQSFDLRPGVSLLGGGNNAGKSTILHGLAVWEFCRTAIEMERGPDTFVAGHGGQGLGLGDDEFSPINVPSLKHLWSNLKTQKDGEPDGYTLKIRSEWDANGSPRYLEFGLSLANDRLFVKTTSSNLAAGDRIPRVAYLPPFAGMTDRETRTTGAIRRRRIGEGLAGAVLRNILLDMQERNVRERRRLRGDRSKISDADLRTLRVSDPWELLQQNLRATFGAELDISPFREEYHSYIQIEVVKGAVDGYKIKRYAGYNKRDLMVEGSGFLQWLSVFALAIDPSIDVLLLDEPDAHLHSSLQEQLLGQPARDRVTDRKAGTRRHTLSGDPSQCRAGGHPAHPERRPGWALPRRGAPESRAARRARLRLRAARRPREAHQAHPVRRGPKRPRSAQAPSGQTRHRLAVELGRVDDHVLPEGTQAALPGTEGGGPRPRRA